jgi:hypothetical protein
MLMKDCHLWFIWISLLLTTRELRIIKRRSSNYGHDGAAPSFTICTNLLEFHYGSRYSGRNFRLKICSVQGIIRVIGRNALCGGQNGKEDEKSRQKLWLNCPMVEVGDFVQRPKA